MMIVAQFALAPSLFLVDLIAAIGIALVSFFLVLFRFLAGSCILQFWNYSSASKPCGCPMCTCMIVNLMPEASLEQQPQNQEVAEVLKSVRRYNLLFLGGACGFIQKVRELPFFIKRIFQGLMDPDTNDTYIAEIRLFAMLLSIIYRATPLDFIPTGGIGIGRVFDCSAIILILILRLVGIYRRRRLMQRVRRLAAMELLQE
ncbi:E3 ubiquitin-protein ligase RNF170 isoform X4 [Gossypium hirsutum]|uniref:E3 ubiquitin-protein ligase RNF170 isoform X4 n=1 Tax=Gossypium hirsutum TaxID=3635 RepID=A0ABM2ZIQ8_GOSHI|nr:E3 ubiquitin-protein ligase RNF170 isoform X4 [Gossypium hirsutum]